MHPIGSTVWREASPPSEYSSRCRCLVEHPSLGGRRQAGFIRNASGHVLGLHPALNSIVVGARNCRRIGAGCASPQMEQDEYKNLPDTTRTHYILVAGVA